MIIFVLMVQYLYGSILYEDNFEDTTITGWTSSGTVQCIVDEKPNKYWEEEDINPDFIRLQYHGLVSMQISDDSDNEVAYAQHSFLSIPLAQEYMVEFYFHFMYEHKDYFKNFCLYKPTLLLSGRSTPVDITLKLNVVKGDSLPLSVIDNSGLHTNVYYFRPDTVYTIDYGHPDTFNIQYWRGLNDFPIERWYRVQIHKVDEDSIDLYINGVYIDTYDPQNGSYEPDQFLIGTTNAATEGGVGVYDDFIITTPPPRNTPKVTLECFGTTLSSSPQK